jgi:hypothetical protein
MMVRGEASSVFSIHLVLTTPRINNPDSASFDQRPQSEHRLILSGAAFESSPAAV